MMIPTEVVQIIRDYADEVVLKQIQVKCKLMRHIREFGPVLHLMVFRHRLGTWPPSNQGPDYIAFQIWQQGIGLLKMPYNISTKVLSKDVLDHRNVPFL